MVVRTLIGRPPGLDLAAEPDRSGWPGAACFVAAGEVVDAFHAAALAAGATENGAPGVRKIYHPDYYGAYVLDPDGNNLEAVCHKPGD